MFIIKRYDFFYNHLLHASTKEKEKNITGIRLSKESFKKIDEELKKFIINDVTGKEYWDNSEINLKENPFIDYLDLYKISEDEYFKLFKHFIEYSGFNKFFYYDIKSLKKDVKKVDQIIDMISSLSKPEMPGCIFLDSRNNQEDFISFNNAAVYKILRSEMMFFSITELNVNNKINFNNINSKPKRDEDFRGNWTYDSTDGFKTINRKKIGADISTREVVSEETFKKIRGELPEWWDGYLEDDVWSNIIHDYKYYTLSPSELSIYDYLLTNYTSDYSFNDFIDNESINNESINTIHLWNPTEWVHLILCLKWFKERNSVAYCLSKQKKLLLKE